MLPTTCEYSVYKYKNRTYFVSRIHVRGYLYVCLCVCPFRRENGSGVCLDLQVIDTVPGAKIEEELETHHVLAGNLYKPRRRVQNTHTQPHPNRADAL